MKFKVGDKVRFDDSVYSGYQGIGEIVRVDTDGTVLVKSDDITDGHSGLLFDDNTNHWWFDIDDVSKLVSFPEFVESVSADTTDVEGIKEALKKVKEGWEKLVESINDVLTVDGGADEDNQGKHMQVCERLNNIYVSKNKDYGNSFGRQYQEYGITSSVIRLDDKMRRLKQITKHGAKVEDETIEDTLLDLANYAILTLMELEGQDE